VLTDGQTTRKYNAFDDGKIEIIRQKINTIVYISNYAHTYANIFYSLLQSLTPHNYEKTSLS